MKSDLAFGEGCICIFVRFIQNSAVDYCKASRLKKITVIIKYSFTQSNKVRTL